LQVETM